MNCWDKVPFFTRKNFPSIIVCNSTVFFNILIFYFIKFKTNQLENKYQNRQFQGVCKYASELTGIACIITVGESKNK